MKTFRILFGLCLGACSIPISVLVSAEDLNVTRDTALHVAALKGDAAAVESLLEQGADPNAINAHGATALHYAVHSERIVAALLARGANPDAVSKIGITPLLGAVSGPQGFAVARRLLDAGADINAQRGRPRGPYASANVLTLAIAAGDARTVALLLERGAEVNPKQGVTPLISAALNGELAIARDLLERGADIDAKGGLPGSALNSAFWGDHPEVARMLIERRADLNLRSETGHRTPPIVWSAYNDAGDPTIAQMLIERGVDIDATNDVGETALSYALKQGDDTDLVHYLRAAGAKDAGPPRRQKTIPNRAMPATDEARAPLVLDAAQRAVDLLQRNSTAFLENRFVREQAKCVSCHQQALPAMAFGLARERGLQVDDLALGRQLVATIAETQRRAEHARELDEATPGRAVTLGYDADGLHALGYPSDELMETISRYLLATQRADGSWALPQRRPPMEDGPIPATAWAARALQLYPPAGEDSAVAESLRRARTWLMERPAPTHNLRVFQLLGLAWSGENVERLRPLAEALVGEQGPDGGWGQLPGLKSDAWATGSTLVALYKAGVATTHPAYRRGLDFLLRTQFDDGSWWVRSRTWPFQPHFDGKFPHGKDQWISAASTAWATIALLLTVEPSVAPSALPHARQLMAKFKQAAEDRTTAAVEADGDASPTAVDFARDIQPVLERSCAECHGGARPKGGFTVATREALLLGGFNGEPAIVPGHAEESDLVRYVSDEVEDLEMPPLARRDKYPALSRDEIALFRGWIDAGAPWPSVNDVASDQ